MTILRRFASYYRPHRKLFILDFGCAVLSGLLELAFPLAVSTFIDRLLPGHDWGLIAGYAGGLVALYLVNTGLMAIVTYWGHVLGIALETEMRRRAFDHLQSLSFSFYDEQKTGHLIARVTRDLEDIGEVAHHGPEDLVIAVMTFVGAFALMFVINVDLAVLTVLVVPPILLVATSYGNRLTHNFRAIFAGIGVFNARVEENIGGMRVVQAFANEAHERQLFARDNQSYQRIKQQGYRLMAASTALTYLSMRSTQMIVMVAGTWFVLHGALTPGGFVGFLLLVGVFFRPVDKISAVLETYPKGIAGFRRYCDLIDTKPTLTERPGARPAPPLAGDIVYEDVTFGYSSERTVLRGVSLHIRAGETVAFVGPSGAGKSTLCALLPRFYDVHSGRIMIDGIDIASMTLTSLRQQIGVVQQEVFLFGGTLRENIAYGRLGASEADILAAAERAQLTGMIANMPEGLDTILGERGVKLSGGQRQRVAIARMFLKNPPILILDEATSALDSETERAIQQSLSELAAGRTSLVIAHRLATIRDADRIVVVDRHGVVEQGRHAELLAAEGAYRRLHDVQFRG
ncbi:ABC transporter ATP-binding protein [Acidisoma sp.]|uniref:ABC transporter ATP-binding protein n=1 Tax=Acidisoma sp. TaxID=1872115 RepID=UPI003B0089A3